MEFNMLRKIFVTLLFIFSTNLFAATDLFIQQTIDDMMKKDAIPGAAVIVYANGKPQTYYVGYQNKNKKAPITKNTIFEVDSISKVMTSLLLAQQVDAAKLQLTDSITKYLAHLPSDYEDITLQNLATHTSGLPYEAPENIQSEAALQNYLKTWTPENSADEKWQYSNFGIGLLGDAIENVTHQNLNQLYRKNILSPLKMQPIALSVSDLSKRDVAQGYDENDNSVKPVAMGIFPAAYGIKMSAQDAEHFLAAAIGLPNTPERILYPMRMTQAAYVRVGTLQQGLGWTIHSLTEEEDPADLINEPFKKKMAAVNDIEILDKPTFDGNNLIDKTGATNGFRAYMAVIPNKNTGIFILANKAIQNNDVVKAGREILFKISGIEVKSEENNREESISTKE